MPRQPNGIITHYELQYHTTINNQIMTLTIIGVAYKLTGLVADTEYQFRVRAFTRVGASPWSNAVIGHTGE